MLLTRFKKVLWGVLAAARSGDVFFLDAKRTWYGLLKEFRIQIEDERRLLPCAFENNAAKMFDDVASSTYSANADQL